MKNHFYTTSPDRYSLLKEEAKRMRNNPTDAEKYLWNYIRGDVMGVRFRRQHPINDYIADFICLSAKLVIEIDGGCHFTEEQEEHDRIRSNRLTEMGYDVLRFTNNQVINDTEKVLDSIRYFVNSRINNN